LLRVDGECGISVGPGLAGLVGMDADDDATRAAERFRAERRRDQIDAVLALVISTVATFAAWILVPHAAWWFYSLGGVPGLVFYYLRRG